MPINGIAYDPLPLGSSYLSRELEGRNQQYGAVSYRL